MQVDQFKLRVYYTISESSIPIQQTSNSKTEELPAEVDMQRTTMAEELELRRRAEAETRKRKASQVEKANERIKEEDLASAAE